MAKSQELPGASPPGPLPELCPGPAGGLTAPPSCFGQLPLVIACVPTARNILDSVPQFSKGTTLTHSGYAPPFLRMLDPALTVKLL